MFTAVLLGLALVAGCGSGGSDDTPASEARLVISPSIARAGGQIEVRLAEPPVGGAISGVAAKLSVQDGQRWRPIYSLFTKSPVAFSRDLDPDVDAVGIFDPTVFSLPSLESNAYRLQRTYVTVASPRRSIRASGTFRVK